MTTLKDFLHQEAERLGEEATARKWTLEAN